MFTEKISKTKEFFSGLIKAILESLIIFASFKLVTAFSIPPVVILTMGVILGVGLLALKQVFEKYKVHYKIFEAIQLVLILILVLLYIIVLTIYTLAQRLWKLIKRLALLIAFFTILLVTGIFGAIYKGSEWVTSKLVTAGFIVAQAYDKRFGAGAKYNY